MKPPSMDTVVVDPKNFRVGDMFYMLIDGNRRSMYILLAYPENDHSHYVFASLEESDHIILYFSLHQIQTYMECMFVKCQMTTFMRALSALAKEQLTWQELDDITL